MITAHQVMDLVEVPWPDLSHTAPVNIVNPKP